MVATGQIIKQIRIEKGYTLRQLASMSGVYPSEIHKIEQGARQRPSRQNLQKIAGALDIKEELLLKAAGLLGETPSVNLLAGMREPTRIIEVPLLISTKAQPLEYTRENIATFIPCVLDDVNRGGAFFFQTDSDSMVGDHILPNSLVLIREQTEVKPTDIALVRVNGDEADLKRVQVKNDSVFLYPSNPNHEVQIHEVSAITIIGVVIKIITNVED